MSKIGKRSMTNENSVQANRNIENAWIIHMKKKTENENETFSPKANSYSIDWVLNCWLHNNNFAIKTRAKKFKKTLQRTLWDPFRWRIIVIKYYIDSNIKYNCYSGHCKEHDPTIYFPSIIFWDSFLSVRFRFALRWPINFLTGIEILYRYNVESRIWNVRQLNVFVIILVSLYARESFCSVKNWAQKQNE